MKVLHLELPGFVILRHEDVRGCGVPDSTVTGNGKTSWWEIKHCTPKYPTYDYQELVCKRLATAGICYYLMYWEVGRDKRTLIVHPSNLSTMVADDSAEGHNHRLVANFIRSLHG